MKETNMEHFESKLEAIDPNFKFGLINGEFYACDDYCSSKCEFFSAHCTGKRIRWLLSEYKPEPVLTKREKAFIEFAETGWRVRTKDLDVIWHKAKPHKEINKLYQEIWVSNKMKFPLYLDGCRGMFPFIRCADEEPWSVEELRKLKVEE